jgi:hypothetical protein
MFRRADRLNKRSVEKINSGKKKITISTLFDKKALQFYDNSNIITQQLIKSQYSKLKEVIKDILSQNSEIIETNSIQIEFKITEFENPNNSAQCDERSSQNKMFFKIGIVQLQEKQNFDERLAHTLIHEIAHSNDIKRHPRDLEDKLFNKYKNSNLLPYNLFITIQNMKSEGFAIWCDRFFKFDNEVIYVDKFLEHKINYRGKIYSSIKSEEKYSAYQLINTIFYPLGLHIYFIITLNYMKNAKILNNFKLINYEKQEFNVLEFFEYEKINNLFLDPAPNKEFVRQWLIQNNFQGLEGQKMPEMPDEFVQEVSERYIELYEKISGKKFEKANTSNVNQRIEQNILTAIS